MNDKFDEHEFLDISEKCNCRPYAREISIRYSGDNYFNQIKRSVREDRRGEVVFCVIRPNGRIITVTSKEYPDGIFRIPTGGIGYDEDILEAAARETMEELGLEAEISSFAGVLKIRFEYRDEFVMFYSYLFIMKETGGRLLEDASDDEVSEVREVDTEGLKAVACRLKGLEGEWADWGKFRYETTNAILQHLMGGFGGKA